MSYNIILDCCACLFYDLFELCNFLNVQFSTCAFYTSSHKDCGFTEFKYLDVVCEHFMRVSVDVSTWLGRCQEVLVA